MANKMINIKLKNRPSKIINVNGYEIKIDYPTIEQQDQLNEILFQSIFIDNKIRETKDPLLIAKLQAEKVNLYNQYMRLFLRFTIKDIKGLPEAIKVENNQLSDDSYEKLCYDLEQVRTLFNVINNEIEFTETDKKK
jgi:hypothetical protein